MPPSSSPNTRRSSSQTSREPPSRLENVRLSVHQLFSGRSRVGTLPRSSTPESPKTPRLALGLGNLPSTRLHIPYLSRTNTISSQRSNSPLSSPRSIRHPYTPLGDRPASVSSLRQEAPQPPAPVAQTETRRNSPRRFVGVDPAELHLAELADTGRRRRRRKSTRTKRKCLPKIKNKKIRAKLLSCFISGLFLTLVLTIYLALALSNRNESQEFHVLLILIILITTIFFCHALIRLCMMIIKPPDDTDQVTRGLPAMVGPGGYANPSTPIRVALARDEEAAGIESDATKLPPPAYGLWRESVRVDPNRIFWQRNEGAALERINSEPEGPEGRPMTANRPPSYLSDDGVDYVVEAAPRSIAPTTDVPLPPHPSERGRAWPQGHSVIV
ncbi:uncharacterized protein LY89DRAFT_36150 [Mollisia scopiformis]|uniref:Uncharacterized protein n=1 Tax=Mollisia scopiformis TaxID=149040 RepID=A0A194XD15_MOLSC|nr:uncharacterized protein LY89DRAFT_36150 [Mollisia scopiformis]KUJ18049.1 hypothetical protein LY89DRAFT_36150 [Mollisia scopiformis]